MCFADVPLDVDVTHVLSGDALLIKGDVGGVPHDDPQDVSEKLTKRQKPLHQSIFFFLGSQTVLKISVKSDQLTNKRGY